ncbi:Polyamine aminopropyltransferase [Candidatus Erwinia haradaeae]|uniref:Polyamine aminopropyltransferase n=1 Tax=Candidatus Erwinia haradaeae TaxID=1922217 RepID=A0A451DD79_9GAMM|nr:polyamine aminopropyltransferase [Candidatus Erwinia haradaeae]VFP84416.1 Polyamine aminopropyltransferase [Candidatus Erwinia haradaeae]
MAANNIWHEKLYSGLGQYFSIDHILCHIQTKHQDLIIFKNHALGHIMALDGIVQTTESDEFIYHEMLTHIPLLTHGAPKSVLIIGGGDGGVLREVSRYKMIERITMVEIDEQIIRLCKKYLPNHSAGAYKDARLTLILDDAANFVKKTNQKFDVIISDSTDPTGPGKNLFSIEFYKECKKCLNDDGIFASQNGVSFLQNKETIQIYQKLKDSFNNVHFYQAAIPTYYGGIMIFALASNYPYLNQTDILTAKDRCAKEKLKFRYYNPAIHANSFALPQYLLNML